MDKLTSSLQSSEMGQWPLPPEGPLKGEPSVDRTGGSTGTLGLSQDILYQEAKTFCSLNFLFGSKDSSLEDIPHGPNPDLQKLPEDSLPWNILDLISWLTGPPR